MALKAIVYGLGLTLLTSALLLIRRQRKTNTSTQTMTGLRSWLLQGGVPTYPTRALHYSLMLLLMLLLSPMSHKTHFGLLLLPGFLLARLAWEKRSPVLLTLLGVLFSAQVVAMHFWSVRLSHFAYWHGIQMLTTVALWSGCMFSAWRWGQGAAVQPAPMRIDLRRAA